MNSQNYYQSLLLDNTDNTDEEINYANTYPIYRNENRDVIIDIMEFKEPNNASFSFLESSNNIYKNKKSNSITKLISSLRQKKEEENKQKEKNEFYKTINLSRFFKPSYKKYMYMCYPFYNNYSSNTNE